VAVSGRRDQEPSFFTVVVWRDQAEHAAESMSKGSRVVVVGRLQQRSWTAKDGSARSIVEVVAEEWAESPLGDGDHGQEEAEPRPVASSTGRCDGTGTQSMLCVPLNRPGFIGGSAMPSLMSCPACTCSHARSSSRSHESSLVSASYAIPLLERLWAYPGQGHRHPEVVVVDVEGQPVLDPDHAFPAVDGPDQERDEPAPFDPALQGDHGVDDVDEEPAGVIMKSPTMTSSMISRQMASSVRMKTSGGRPG
jgi:single-stranded DNA-binding protein